MKVVASKPTITRKELEGVLDCLIQDELYSGSTVKEFESSLTSLTGRKFALAVTSLTAAYHLAYLALEIKKEDEVILPAFFDKAALNALQLTGATPVLVDSDENGIIPSPDQYREAITDRTKAIVAGHTFGFHTDMAALVELGLPVIEDASHALGCETTAGTAGGLGTISVVSFAPEMMVTTGNGGMVLTANTRYISTMREYRLGKEKSLDYAMTDFQAAMGLSQIQRLQSFLKRRREIAVSYYNALRHTPHTVPYPYNEAHGYQSFPVLFDSPADKISRVWKKEGVELHSALEAPLHSLRGYRGLDYPHADRAAKRLHCIPLYPALTKKETERVTKLLSSFI